MEKKCECIRFAHAGIDIQTPRNEILTAFYKRSFAYHTVKNRMPIMVTQCIDGLVRNKEEIGNIYGTEGLEDLKTVIGDLSKLKYEIQTNKPIVEIKSQEPDAKLYNSYLKELLDKNNVCTYFSTVFLHAECYMYRRIRETFELTKALKDFDIFRKQKEDSYEIALPIIISMSKLLLKIITTEDGIRDNKADFKLLLKLNLWGNKCDLSLTGGEQVTHNEDFVNKIEELDSFILCDQSEQIWEAVNAENRFQIVDIILDNAGYEVFTDLCLADFIITRNLAKSMRFYVKTIPWFVSDVTIHDFYWILEKLAQSENSSVRNLGNRWKNYVDLKIWTFEISSFWTLPFEFKHMFSKNETLYRRIARAKLAIFKGDLNYRKLFGERSWDPVTPIEEALEGFHPTKLCSLRTIKSDIICGLRAGIAEKTEAIDEDWLVTGKYGVIQYSDKVVRLL